MTSDSFHQSTYIQTNVLFLLRSHGGNEGVLKDLLYIFSAYLDNKGRDLFNWNSLCVNRHLTSFVCLSLSLTHWWSPTLHSSQRGLHSSPGMSTAAVVVAASRSLARCVLDLCVTAGLGPPGICTRMWSPPSFSGPIFHSRSKCRFPTERSRKNGFHRSSVMSKQNGCHGAVAQGEHSSCLSVDLLSQEAFYLIYISQIKCLTVYSCVQNNSV